MDWQQQVSLLIVAVAAGLLGWGKLRSRAGHKRGKTCGCVANPGDGGRQGSIVFHARKGERPRVLVKMN